MRFFFTVFVKSARYISHLPPALKVGSREKDFYHHATEKSYKKLSLVLVRDQKNQGFTLYELIIVMFILGILSAMSLVNVVKQIENGREAEAKNALGVINRAQQAYYFEKAVFASQMDELGTDLSVSSGLYQYSIISPITNTEVHHLAIPNPPYNNDIKILTSAVYRLSGSFISLNCEGNAPGVTPSIVSQNSCLNGNIID
jgi:prepilin-type N-terminal cleavage/methylation domain-containing protein